MPADLTLSSLATEYVQVPVAVTIAGAPYNPTGDAVFMQFVPASGNQEPSGTWNSGNWVTTAQNTYIAQCLVGPANGGVSLTPGAYVVWVKIVDNPEVPVQPAGTLAIT